VRINFCSLEGTIMKSSI